MVVPELRAEGTLPLFLKQRLNLLCCTSRDSKMSFPTKCIFQAVLEAEVRPQASKWHSRILLPPDFQAPTRGRREANKEIARLAL